MYIPDHDELILSTPDSFEYLSIYDKKRLIPLFCIEDMEKCKIFSINGRPLKVVKSIRDKYNLTEECTTEEMNSKFKNHMIGVVRRKELNGIKQDKDYYIMETKIVEIRDTHRLDMSSIKIDTGEYINPSRIFLL